MRTCTVYSGGQRTPDPTPTSLSDLLAFGIPVLGELVVPGPFVALHGRRRPGHIRPSCHSRTVAPKSWPPTIKLFPLPLHHCHFATVINLNVSVWYAGYLMCDQCERILLTTTPPKGSRPTDWEPMFWRDSTSEFFQSGGRSEAGFSLSRAVGWTGHHLGGGKAQSTPSIFVPLGSLLVSIWTREADRHSGLWTRCASGGSAHFPNLTRLKVA